MAFLFADIRRVLSTTPGVSATSVGFTALLTVPAGHSVVIEKVVIRCTAHNAITTPATAQIERLSSPGSGDLFSSESWTNVLVTGDEFAYDLRGKSLVLAAGETARLNITVAAVGTAQFMSVDVLGYMK